MAGKKGRSGRKKMTIKKKTAVLLPPVALLPEHPPAAAAVVEVPAEKPLLEKMKEKISNLIPMAAAPEAAGESPSPTPNSSASNTPEFEVVAAEIENKYADGEPAAARPGPETVIPPVSFGPGHVLPPETVRSILVMTFGGLAKAHGKHWELAEMDADFLTPVNVSMLDEQAPRWLADSPNRNFWVWVIVMVLFIVSRAKSGGRVIEWGMDKIGGLVSRVGGSTKTD